MKQRTKQKWVHFLLLAAAVIALVEFQKFQKRRAPVCENGVCAVPADYAAAQVTGPQTVPLMPPAQTDDRPLPKLIEFEGAGAPNPMMNVVLDGLTQEYSSKLRIQIANPVDQPNLTAKYQVQKFPTQIFLDAEGNELFRHEGFISKDDILKKWAELGTSL